MTVHRQTYLYCENKKKNHKIERRITSECSIDGSEPAYKR